MTALDQQLHHNSKDYAAEPTVEWNFTIPPAHRCGQKLWLLTIGGISVTGQWYGDLGENFVAWSPMLTYDKDLFNKTIAEFSAKRSQIAPN